jgi:hypothetical protein
MFLLFFGVCVGFMSGYGLREMISQRRRREERKKRYEAERLLVMRADRRAQSDIHGAELAKLPKAKGKAGPGRGKAGAKAGPAFTDAPTREDLGVTKKRATRANKLAAMLSNLPLPVQAE